MARNKSCKKASKAARKTAATITESVAESVENVAEKLGDFAEAAGDKVGDFAAAAGEKVSQVANNISESLSNARGATSTKVSDIAATVSSVAGDFSKQAAPKRKCPFRWGLFLVLTAVGLSVVFIVRQLLSSKDDGWTEYKPSDPYTKPTPSEGPADNGEAKDEDRAKPEESDDEEIVDADTAEAAETADADQDDADSYVGENPPEGFEIKGNAKSMKYHTTDSSAYAVTSADVWFKTEDAAAAAGYTKAKS